MTPVSEGRPAAGSDTQAMREIAEHTGIAPEIVQAVHAQELQQLAEHARIQDFIPLLAMKHVREFFLHAPPEGNDQAGREKSGDVSLAAQKFSRADAAAESRHRDRHGQPQPLLPQH